MKKIFMAISIFFCLTVNAKDAVVMSPDKKIQLHVSDASGTPSYRVTFNNKSVIEPSKLGLVFQEVGEFGENFVIVKTKANRHKERWELPWGERRFVNDEHNELRVRFQQSKKRGYTFDVVFRVFNDGLGFRYDVPKQSGLSTLNITDEITEFSLANADKSTAWWIPSRGWNRYEYVHNTTPLNEVVRAHTPFTLKNPNGVHISIHEAALVDYAAMTLDQRRPGILKADLTPWSDGIRVKTKAGFTTPWRTIQIAEDAVGLLNSNLILNLNEPNQMGDVEWVEPGKYVGIWWGMHVNENTWGSGKKHGATTSETIRYMDFAAKYGFAGVLVEGWNIGWDGSWYHNGDVFSFTDAYDDFDLSKVSAHGLSKGVRLIGHHETSGSVTNYKNQMKDAYALYAKHGVAQVKTGYVADGGKIKRVDENNITRYEWHDGQFMVGEYLRSVKEAAKHKISINTHEPIKATGLRRTYPNWIAREGARGQEFNAWGSPPNPPEHTATLPFTRMLAGPMDFTPGIFNMEFDGGLDAQNRPQTTLAKQLSLYVVLYSPIQMAADLPRHYEANLPAFQFILDVPTDWEESIALAGEVADYVVFARKQRGKDDWFIGGLTDEDKRTTEVKLDFLDKGKSYIAHIYRDDKEAHWLTNPYALVIEKKKVSKGDTLTIPMAASGGFAIRLEAK
jgi:alpha-glucosidase